MFSDDGDNDAEATDILYDIARRAKSYGLIINADKTKVLTSDFSPPNIQLDGVQIEQVREFKYLESLIQEKKIAATTGVFCRIGHASAAFASLKLCLR